MSNVAARPHPARAITLSALAALLIALFALVTPVSADPPGNNGTVKIDGVPFDDHPDNEPHPGCVFQVDFYGYDQGALFASVTFEHWNPTGDGHGDVLLHEEGIFIGEDSNAGGGSEDGLDASRTYDLSAQLAGMEPHPQQGYHIKLTVHADGSIGSDVKHKVFWVECAGTPPGGEEGQALIQKVDQNGAGKAGAVFTLTGITDSSFSATATTSATGSAGFTALVEGEYSLAETTPPTGCTGFAGSISITVDAEGDLSVGTLPAGVSFSAGTLTVVNTCGGGSQANTTAAAASITPPSCTAAGTLVVPANTASVTYSVAPAYSAGATGTFVVTATANAGFVLVGQSQWTLTVAPMLTGDICVSGGGNQPGGGTQPGAGGEVRGGTLGGSPTGALPNTSVGSDASTGLASGVLALVLLTLVGLAVAEFAEVRNRR